jgi:hypothetical protein
VRTYYEMASFARRFCEEWLVRRGRDTRPNPSTEGRRPNGELPAAQPERCREQVAVPEAGDESGHQPPPEPVPHVSDYFVPEDEWDGDIENIPF